MLRNRHIVNLFKLCISYSYLQSVSTKWSIHHQLAPTISSNGSPSQYPWLVHIRVSGFPNQHTVAVKVTLKLLLNPKFAWQLYHSLQFRLSNQFIRTASSSRTKFDARKKNKWIVSALWSELPMHRIDLVKAIFSFNKKTILQEDKLTGIGP